MNFLSFIPVIGKILDKGLDVVDQLVEDKDKANEIKAAIKDRVLIQNHEENLVLIKGQIEIILSETKGHWLQRNWRPLLMMICIAIIFNNYVLFPYLSMWTAKVTVLELPSGLWSLLTLGVGGYIAGRSVEKVLKKD
jgi:hypothetical protein